jgi:hypothetical protein
VAAVVDDNLRRPPGREVNGATNVSFINIKDAALRLSNTKAATRRISAALLNPAADSGYTALTAVLHTRDPAAHFRRLNHE